MIWDFSYFLSFQKIQSLLQFPQKIYITLFQFPLRIPSCESFGLPLFSSPKMIVIILYFIP